MLNQSNRPVYRSKPVTHAILNLNLNSNRSNRPVNRSNRPVYRCKPVTHAILNLDLNSNRSNRPVYWFKPITHAILNLDLNSTGFRSNRSGKPEPDPGGYRLPVGIENPGRDSEVGTVPPRGRLRESGTRGPVRSDPVSTQLHTAGGWR